MSKSRQFFMGSLCAAVLAAGATAQSQLDRAVDQSERATESAQQSQAQINRIDDQRGDLFAEYRATLQRIESRSLYVEQQEVFLQSQANEINDLRRQIDQVDEITSDLYPMQFQMIDELERFIMLDIPFRRDERLRRVERARTNMDDHNIAPAEKYRSIIEAYEIEADYGRFITSWEGELTNDPNAPKVDFVLFGRVAWVYMTKDESELGIWNPQGGEAGNGGWESLSNSYLTDVRQAKRIADEQASQNILRGPVPGPTVVSDGASSS